MKKIIDVFEIGACLALLLLSEGWQVARKVARPVGVGMERLALVALYLFAEIAGTVSGLFAADADSDSLPGAGAPAGAGADAGAAAVHLPAGALSAALVPSVGACASARGEGPSGAFSGAWALPGAAGTGGRGQGLPGACSTGGGAGRGLRGRDRDRDGKGLGNVAIRLMRRLPLASFRGLMNIPVR